MLQKVLIYPGLLSLTLTGLFSTPGAGPGLCHVQDSPVRF